MKCLLCGKEFEPRLCSQKYCSSLCESVARANSYCCKKKYTSKPTADSKPPRPKPSKSLDDWTREARACNLDYGNYRVLTERGKTFDELFAERDKHSTPAHAHVHKWL